MDTSLSLTVKRLSDGWRKDLLKIVTISCFFAGMALLLRNGALRDQFLHRPLLQEILSAGDTPGQVCRHAFLFVGTFSLLIGVGLPRLWVSAIAGAAFGAMEGTLLALAASVIGATIVYHIGRFMLSDLLKRRFARHFSVWQTRFQKNAFWWVLYMRLFPLSNATLAGLVCGACRLPAKPYLSGSLLGFIPLTVVFAVFGSGGAKGNFYQIALGTLLLLVAVGGRKLLAAIFVPRNPWCPGRSRIDDLAMISGLAKIAPLGLKRKSSAVVMVTGGVFLLAAGAIFFWFQPSSGTLAGYVRSRSFRISEIPRNLSGITYCPESKTLFMVSNGPPRIYETTLEGHLVRQIALIGFHDTEDIAFLEQDTFAVIEERRRTISVFDIFPGTTTITFAGCRHISVLSPDTSNAGLEGLDWDPVSRNFLVSRENSPRSIYRVPFSDSVNIFQVPEFNNLPWLKLGDYAAIHFDSASRRLLILSRTSRKIRDYGLNGREMGSLNLSLFLPELIRAEGLTVGPGGEFYVCSEPDRVDVFVKTQEKEKTGTRLSPIAANP